MRTYLIGFALGTLVTGLLAFGLTRWQQALRQPKIDQFAHQPVTPDPAGPVGNLSRTVPVAGRFSLTVHLADTAAAPIVDSAPFVRYEIHLAKLEARLVLLEDELVNHWETLNLTQPTIELLSLRGGGAVAEIGGANLAAGRYDVVKLTLGAVRGVRPDGARVEIPYRAEPTIVIERGFGWAQPGVDHQLVLDVDTLGSVTGADGTETFAFQLRRVLDNDEEI